MPELAQKARKILFAASSLLFLEACVDSPWQSIHSCDVGGLKSSALVPIRADDLEVMLPTGSVLVRRNTRDARYWIWDTPMGQFSVTWIGDIARRSRLESMSLGACRVGTDRSTFIVDWTLGELVAVSGPMIANGAGLLVRIEALPPGITRAEAMELLQHVRVVPGGDEDSR